MKCVSKSYTDKLIGNKGMSSERNRTHSFESRFDTKMIVIKKYNRVIHYIKETNK